MGMGGGGGGGVGRNKKAIVAIYAPKISTAPYVMVFLGADAFTRASGRGLNPGN